MDLCIYDFQGMQSIGFNDASSRVIGFINEKNQSQHIADWIHSVFFFVDANEGRFSLQHADFIRKLKKNFFLSIHIVLANCQMSEARILEVNRLEKYIRTLLIGSGIHIMRMSAPAPVTTKSGSIIEYGNKIIRRENASLLLKSDISQVIAGTYSALLHTSLSVAIKGLEKETNKLIAKMNPISLIVHFAKEMKESEPDDWGFNNDTYEGKEQEEDDFLDADFDIAEEKITDLFEQLDNAYHVQADMVNDFCEEYGNSAGYSIDISDTLDECIHLDELDIDNIIEKSIVGKMIKKMKPEVTLKFWKENRTIPDHGYELTYTVCTVIAI